MTEPEFLELVKQHQNIIYKLVGLYASGLQEKQDLYQEILLQCWKSLPSFRGDAKFSTWLYRICLNTIFTQKRRLSVVEFRDSVNEISPSAVQGGDDLRSLQFALRQLAETDRAIISMHLDGYDNTEIADITGITLNHVSVKIHRIKKVLAEFLKKEL